MFPPPPREFRRTTGMSERLRLCRVVGFRKGAGMLAKRKREPLRVQAGSDSMGE